MTHDPYLPCEDSRQSGGKTKFPFPTDFEARRIEIDRNLEVEHQDPSQERIMGDDVQNPITEDMDEFGKIGVKSLSYIQSQIHSDHDSAESIAKSDLKMDNYGERWLHRCIHGSEKKTLILPENL